MNNIMLNLAGGPLGELVQWSDIVAALYILGHDIIITSEIKELKAYVTWLILLMIHVQLDGDL